jgi:hypothetical protein
MRAYAVHHRHRSSVPGSDVRVEHRRPVKRLRTEPHARKEPEPHEPEPRASMVSLGTVTQRLVGRVRAERCAGARRSRCGATAAVGAGAKPKRASVLSVVTIIILAE